MGKFNLKVIEKRAKRLEGEKAARIKVSLSLRPLLETIPESPSKKHPLENGILLFGKHKGERISEYNSLNYLEWLFETTKLDDVTRQVIGLRIYQLTSPKAYSL